MPARARALVAREPNGRRQRLPAARLREVQNGRRLTEMATVLSQPHRQGDLDPRRATALGRFCQRMKCRPELYDAANEYLQILHWWGAAIGRPRGLGRATARGGDGPTEATVRGWRRTLDRVAESIRVSERGHASFSRFTRLVVDDVDLPPDPAWDSAMVEILREVAVQLGRLSGRTAAFD